VTDDIVFKDRVHDAPPVDATVSRDSFSIIARLNFLDKC
jgi:hypothetical protein